MITVVKLALKLNMGSHPIIDYLYSIGLEKAGLNTKLSESQEKDVIAHFTLKDPGKLKKAKPPMVLDENIFTKVRQYLTYEGENTIASYFTDEQAKEICSKMSNGKIRHYSNLFLLKQNPLIPEHSKNQIIDFERLKYQIHFLATKALNFYGGKILTFVYKLRHLPLHKKNVQVLSSNKKWHRNEEAGFPTFQILRTNTNGNYYIRFTKLYERKHGNDSAFTILDFQRKKVASFSNNGTLIQNFSEQFPRITIFEEIINGKQTIYSGYDDDVCDICGLSLTDPISVKYVRGPICRNNYPL